VCGSIIAQSQMAVVLVQCTTIGSFPLSAKRMVSGQRRRSAGRGKIVDLPDPPGGCLATCAGSRTFGSIIVQSPPMVSFADALHDDKAALDRESSGRLTAGRLPGGGRKREHDCVVGGTGVMVELCLSAHRRLPR
jgi:hypothetical protein